MDNTKPHTYFSKWKPIEIMLAVLFLLAPFYYHPNIGGEGLRIPNNITVWMVSTIVIWYSFHQVLKRPTFVIPRYFIYIAAFPTLITLGGFITGVEQPLKWLFRLLFIWGGLAFFFSLFQHGLKQGRLDRILFVVLISALLQGLVGIAQIWLQNDMPFWLPKSPNGIPSGLFQQINNQASYQVTAIMIAAYLITRPFLSHGKLVLQAVVVVSVACAAFLVGFSGSRIGVLSLILGLLIVIPALWQRFKMHKLLSMIMLVTLVTGVGLGVNQSDDRIIDKAVAMQSGYSGAARLGIYSIALDLINQQPVFGHGIGSFGRVWQYAKPDFYKIHPNAALPNQFVDHPHNEMMLWLVEGGLIAGIGLLLVLFGAMQSLKHNGWQRGGTNAAILLPIAIHTQVELPFYMSALHWFVFITLLAVTCRLHARNKIKTITISLTRLLNVISVSLFAIFMVLFVHTIRSNWDFVAFFKGEQNDNPMPYAYKNPYLSEQARWIDMSAIMYSSMEYGQHENVRVYTEWGEKLLLERPDIDLYVKLVDGYQFLGDKKSYCTMAERGLALYPEADRLKLAVEFCRY
ncbi:MAG: Wzy polymerase domain-containing protein [Gammaproteobacteria bacterium]|nr:Wzy polymerase domain-containing protein [Gammaproteobacteria bacterium]